MRTRYGVSPWVHLFPDSRRPALPPLRGEHTADVIVAGGGLTGCATACACASAGLRTVLVEAGRLGQGGAGRSAGLLLPDPGPDFRDVASAHGLRAARTIFEAWRRASLDAAAQIRRLGIRCGLAPRDLVVVAWPEEEKLLRREHQARTGAGLAATWLTRRQTAALTKLEASASMRLRDGFGLNPYRACLGLAAAARARGARVFERTALRRARFGSKAVEVDVDGGHIRAGTLIVTTGTATPEFKPLMRHFRRRDTYLVLTEPMPAAMRREAAPEGVMIRDRRSPRHRIRWTDDHRVLVAGADQAEVAPASRPAVLVQRTGQLMYELLTMYPAISGLRPEFGWSVLSAETADGLMYIGPHRNYPRHLFALGGGESVTGAFLAARLLLRAVRGEPAKGDEVFAWTR